MNVTKKLDMDWLVSQARDENTKHWLKKIGYWREQTFKNNEFVHNDQSFALRLGSKVLRFDADSAFSAIEVYQEIFKERDHFLASDFSGAKAKVVFDIGANQGFYTLRLKEINPECKIIAVEPNFREFAIMTENFKKNNLKNIFSEKKAVASFVGLTTLEIVPQIGAIGGKRVKIPERPWMQEAFIQKIAVKTTTLDALFEKYGVLKADIVKIDVEGFEIDILEKSFVLNRIDKIVVEYHSRELRENVISILSANDFLLVFEDNRKDSYYGDLYFRK